MHSVVTLPLLDALGKQNRKNMRFDFGMWAKKIPNE